MGFLLDLGYFFFFALSSPYFLFKMITTGKYRAGLFARLGKLPSRKSERPCVWVHGVSVGEVLAAKSFIREFERGHPDWEVVISSTTNTGIQVARKNYKEEMVFYFPLDFGFVTERVIKKIKPSIIILMELEVWPNFLRSADRRGIKTLIINGRISEKSFNLQRRFWFLLEGCYRRIAHICVQTKEYADRFRALGVESEKIEITGTMKYDSVQTDVDDKEVSELKKILNIKEGEKVLLGASTHRTEEAVLLDAFLSLRKDFPQLRLIIVPRHPERFNEVAGLLESSRVKYIRKSKINEGASADGNEVILGDTMGELADMSKVSDIVFVGGSLIRHGGQNMLEPAGYSKAVLFGPHIFNFKETVELLLAEEAAIMINSADELEGHIRRLLCDEASAREMGGRAREVIKAQKGATTKNVKAVEKVLAIKKSF